MGLPRAAAATCAACALLLPAPLLAVDLEKLQKITVSSASTDFSAENPAGYNAASKWYGERLLRDAADSSAPYMACAEYSDGREALTSLETNFGKSAIHRVSNSEMEGACFIVTASPSAATDMLSAPETFSLLSAGPFLPSLKLASGLVAHGSDASDRSDRLRSTYGEHVSPDNVRGFHVRLSPGILPATASDSVAGNFVRGWHDGLMQPVSVRGMSFWSAPDVDRSVLDKTRVREWSRAAAVVDDLASKHSRPVEEICKLGKLRVHHVGDDLLLVQGVDHLLPGEKPASEAKMACYMALLTKLADKPEVLRVSPVQKTKTLNAVASAVVQSATTTETPLLDAGLDGHGEVIQVVDTGLDETSCFFADDDGLQVEHGHLFDGVRLESDGNVSLVLNDYAFTYDLSRRKVVQYIEMFKRADGDGGDGSTEDSFTYASDYLGDPYDFDDEYYTYYDDDSEYYSYETWSEDSFCAGVQDDFSYHFSFLFDDTTYSTSSSPTTSTTTPYSSFTGGFHKDTVGGHGTWTAGSAAGAISDGAGVAEAECYGDELPGCAGGCFSASILDEYLDDDIFDLDLFCPAYECDGNGFSYSYCLGDDPVETLHQHGGVAPGAQIAMFDASYTGLGEVYAVFAGNHVWESAMDTGAKIHSNSYGGETFCEVTEDEILYDTFMYENPEHLLIFSAGNSGGYKDIASRESCTVGSPGLGKNTLTVGATSSGPAGGTETGTDGRLIYERLGITDYSVEGYPWICMYPFLGAPSSSAEQADIETIAWFSSYGPAADGRIKPEVVAPGDQVFSASSDGTDDHTCKLVAYGGTSASCPVVAGAAALVRQYFKDSSFYANHVSSKAECATDQDSSFQCSAFSPSSATVKAMIINSANLMGGSSEPDGFRGFGRVHLDAGMPLDGTGALGLLVADSATTTIDSYGENTELIDVDGDAGLDLRVTLAWIDPPTTALSAVQLMNDLDLVVTAPSGATYTMWESGASDAVNVVERVIVPAAFVESGQWKVTVSAKQLLDEQGYSLVVAGAI